MIALTSLGRFDEAVAGYEKVLARKPEDPAALMGLGEALYSAGLYELSVPHLEELLKVEPSSRKAKALLASCTKQIALDSGGIIPAGEIVERLRTPLEGGLMCMCPMHAKLMARIRFRAITFSTDRTELDATALAQLAEFAGALKTEAFRGGRFLIEGYADPLGAREYNIELSAKRAEAVKRRLVEVLQVDPTLISVAGVGASRPWTTNETPAGRRANRRIEVLSLGVAERDELTDAGQQRRTAQ